MICTFFGLARASVAIPLIASIFAGPAAYAAAKLPAQVIGKSPFTVETEQALEAVAKKYKKLQNWEATFTEERFSVGLGRGTFNEGKLSFASPNRFRYSLMQPENSDFISNGKEAWFVSYKEGRGKPAFVRHFKNLKAAELDRYLIVLRGIDSPTAAKKAQLAKNFAVVGKVSNEGVKLELEPKTQSEVARITLQFKNDQDAPERAIIEDSLGNRTTIVLARARALDAVKASTFAPDYPSASKVEEL